MSVPRVLDIGAGAALAVAIATPAIAEIDCNGRNDPSAEAVCGSVVLHRLDAQVATAYINARGQMSGDDAALVKLGEMQARWTRERQACGSFPTCLLDQYQRRLAVLEQDDAGVPKQAAIAPPPEQSAPPRAAPSHRSNGGAANRPTKADHERGEMLRNSGSGWTDEEVMQTRLAQERAARKAALPQPAVEETGSQPSSASSQQDAASAETSSAGYRTLFYIGFGLASLAIGAVYFIPTIIAFRRGHAYRGVIFVLNLFAAWTAIGWVGALVWALWPSGSAIASPVLDSASTLPASYSSTLEQLEGLGRLRAAGVLTEDEFAARKAALLAS